MKAKERHELKQNEFAEVAMRSLREVVNELNGVAGRGDQPACIVGR